MKEDIIDLIRKERRKQGITQVELAKIVGCPQPSIVRIETKKISPSLSTIQRICDVLGMEITLKKRPLIQHHLVIHSNINDEYMEVIYRRFKPYFIKTTIEYNLDLSFPEENRLSEKECIELLKDDETHLIPLIERNIELNITSNYDLYFSFINCPYWIIGNAKTGSISQIVHSIIEEYLPILLTMNAISTKDLVKNFANPKSKEKYTLDEYKAHLIKTFIDKADDLESVLKNFN